MLASGEGDLTQRLEVKSDDDLGEIAININTFIEQLNHMMREVKTVTESLSSGVDELRKTAQTTTTLLDAQKAESDNVVSSVKQLSVSSETVSQNASHATQFIKEANEAGDKSKLNIANAQASLEKLSSEIDSATSKVGQVLETSLSGSVEALLNRKADIAITPFVPPGYIAQDLLNVDFRAVAHPNHALFKLEREITQSDLEQHCQVVVRDSGTKRNQDAGWLRSEQRITVSYFATSLAVLKRGLAFAWLPFGWVEADLISGNLKELNLDIGASRAVHVHLIKSAGENAGAAVSLLSQLLVEIHSRR